MALAIEAGRNGLLHALFEHASWLTIYPIQPATSARFRLAFAPSGAKDDAPDAERILALFRQHRDRLTSFTPDTPAARQLAALVEQRRGAVDERTGLANQLILLLNRVYRRRWDWPERTWPRPSPSPSSVASLRYARRKRRGPRVYSSFTAGTTCAPTSASRRE